MLGLLILKGVVLAAITLASGIGVWAPLYFARSRRNSSSFTALSSSHADLLSLCNCLSAGMLLANALGHFFPDAFDGGCTERDVSHHSLWLLIGILFPATLNRLCPVPHGHGTHHPTASPQPLSAVGALFASSALMLVVLMSFHFATEGMLIGVESSSSALLAIAIPLSIHRFFDGVVVGVSLAKEREGRAEAEASFSRTSPDETHAESSVPFTTERISSLHLGLPPSRRVAVLLWLLVTPCAFLITELMQGPSPQETLQNLPTHSSVCVAAPEQGHTSAMTTVKAFGSGSFIFVALELLSEEDVKGLRPTLALLLGVLFAFLLLYVSPEEHH